jgi:hypothetical protein
VEALLTFALLVIAAVLFYRFVERRHKFIVAKVTGALIALGLLVIGGLAWQKHLEHKTAEATAEVTAAATLTVRRREWGRVRATYLPESTRLLPNPSPDWPKSFQRSRVAFRACNVSSDTVDHTRIFPITWSKGHSTRSRIGSDSTGLETDAVLIPSACTVVTFEVSDQIMDSVETSVRALARGRWNYFGDP